jgi:hypothetical protein
MSIKSQENLLKNSLVAAAIFTAPFAGVKILNTLQQFETSRETPPICTEVIKSLSEEFADSIRHARSTHKPITEMENALLQSSAESAGFKDLESNFSDSTLEQQPSFKFKNNGTEYNISLHVSHVDKNATLTGGSTITKEGTKLYDDCSYKVPANQD